ncbi:MAG: gamma-glutamylcyclotransferase [Bdellovibrionales bacterium]|nr:gamma-glutamylcyclotransferase [Bdellovibrionales bacterium]
MSDTLLFVYGSLISSEARTLTGQAGQVWPARANGLKRFWNAFADLGYAVLGLIPEVTATCNGLLVELSEEELSKFDQKEHRYRRSTLSAARIEHGGRQIRSSERVWIYMPHKVIAPTDAYPIVQSYIDVVLSGCMEVSEEFAVEFIRTTVGWERPWINDRGTEQYQRALRQVQCGDLIDELLKAHCPKGLTHRYP